MRALLLLPLVLSLTSFEGANDEGSLSTFRDTSLGFSYQYPASFRSNEKLSAAVTKILAGDAATPELNPVKHCVSVPLAVLQGGGSGAELGLLYLVKIDNACLGVPGTVSQLGEAAQTLVQTLRLFGQSVSEDAVHFKVAGHEAAFVQGSAPAKMLGEDAMLHAGSVCMLVKQSTVCWLIADTNYRRMPALVANPITFDGEKAVPLVEKDLVQRW